MIDLKDDQLIESQIDLSSALLVGDLEGSRNVYLAPIKGQDLRRSLPKEYFIKNPLFFLLKIIFAVSLIVVGWYCVWYSIKETFSFFSISTGIVGVCLCGLMYAHLIELQHECLHFHAFNSPRLNRLFGVLAGIFMFSSHSHYRYDHLRHHAYLGTNRNLEHFDYRFSNLGSIRGFIIAFFDLNRYKRICTILIAVILCKPIKNVNKKKIQNHIKQEYFLYACLFIFSVIASFYFSTWLFALAWWLPTLFLAEGIHFMIEMPEHYGLNTQNVPDIIENTRTIRTNFIVAWFVNGNHTHAAHHFHQGVPICNVKKLNKLIKPKLKVVEASYFSFFTDVIKGRIQHTDNSCMTR